MTAVQTTTELDRHPGHYLGAADLLDVHRRRLLITHASGVGDEEPPSPTGKSGTAAGGLGVLGGFTGLGVGCAARRGGDRGGAVLAEEAESSLTV